MSNFDFDSLAVNKVATEQWIKLASSMYGGPRIEKTADRVSAPARFWGALTGKTVAEASRAVPEASRAAAEAGSAAARARQVHGAALKGGKADRLAITAAKRAKDVAKANIAGMSLGGKAWARIKQPVGLGEYAKLRKARAGVTKAELKGGASAAKGKETLESLTAAERAAAQAGQTHTEAARALQKARDAQSSARTGAAIVGGGTLAGLAATSPGGRSGRGPVIVT